MPLFVRFAVTQTDYLFGRSLLTAKFRHLESFSVQTVPYLRVGKLLESRSLPFLLLNRGGISIALCRRQQKETYNENGTIGEQ